MSFNDGNNNNNNNRPGLQDKRCHTSQGVEEAGCQDDDMMLNPVFQTGVLVVVG